LLALDDNTTTGTSWIQLLTGVAPTAALTINNEAADGTHDAVAVTARTIPSVFLGAYTGTLIGAFGIGVDPDDVGASDSLRDLLNAPQVPPNNVTFDVTGLDITGGGLEDVVVVTDRSAGVINKAQLAADGIQASGLGTLTVNSAIPTDTPSTGWVRPLGDGGVYDRVAYTSWTGSVFTLTGTLPDGISDLANVFIGYVDKTAVGTTESFTSIYLAPRDLFIRVRNGNATTPIKTFDAPSQLTANGGTIAAIRTPDI
jgi:hypothetical protein